MENQHIREIIEEINIGIQDLPTHEQYADQRARIESEVWDQLYDDYKAGWIPTVEAAFEQFMGWRTAYIVAGRLALGYS